MDEVREGAWRISDDGERRGPPRHLIVITAMAILILVTPIAPVTTPTATVIPSLMKILMRVLNASRS